MEHRTRSMKSMSEAINMYRRHQIALYSVRIPGIWLSQAAGSGRRPSVTEFSISGRSASDLTACAYAKAGARVSTVRPVCGDDQVPDRARGVGPQPSYPRRQLLP
jgi:hypothetical protein